MLLLKPADLLDPRGFLTSGARTRDAFDSFSLHVEFRTPFMPDAPAWPSVI